MKKNEAKKIDLRRVRGGVPAKSRVRAGARFKSDYTPQ
jgi:hypothetical protein